MPRPLSGLPQTTVPPIERSVRTKIASRQASLLQLNQQINDAGKIIDTFNKNTQVVTALGRQVATTSAQVTVLAKQLVDEERKPAHDINKITAIQIQLGPDCDSFSSASLSEVSRCSRNVTQRYRHVGKVVR